MSAPILAVEDLSITFAGQAPGRKAVSGVSFSIAEGETLGLVGESGSGKSATSLALMRLLPPSATLTGQIRYRNQDLLALSAEQMRRHRGKEIAMIFQEPMTALNPVMRVGKQIGEAVLAYDPRLARASVRARVIKALEEVGIPEPERRMSDYPHQFSGGQRQRVLIAMAIVNRPRLLIADEPTTALDVTVQAQILALLRKLRDEYRLSMLFISHDLAVIGQIADRVAVMQHGKLVEEAPSPDIFLTPQHPYTRKLLAAAPTMTTERGVPLAAN